MRKTHEPKKPGSGTSGGTNGSDVVMVAVSLCDVCGASGARQISGRGWHLECLGKRSK